MQGGSLGTLGAPAPLLVGAPSPYSVCGLFQGGVDVLGLLVKQALNEDPLVRNAVKIWWLSVPSEAPTYSGYCF